MKIELFVNTEKGSQFLATGEFDACPPEGSTLCLGKDQIFRVVSYRWVASETKSSVYGAFSLPCYQFTGLMYLDKEEQ